ncbi:MAG TPA: sigma-70 family RNA polymerase sigma factor [Planctomycetota bacterium]|jgi:RNA polymerase sigma-70 factor (ECF subfamily)|nr:sigma-70 family RNA polymerase sigma factor [Planctomycetota bacterium]
MAEDAAARPIEELLTHRRFVRSLARALVHDEARAEDVEQETWLRALRSPPAFDAGIRAWLKRVVRSAASDANRRDVRREAREASSAGPEAQPSAAEIAARLETERRLVEAVGALDEKYRRVVFLRFFEELPPRAIAKKLECPVATVRTQVARALEQLRKKLDEVHGGSRKDWLAAMAPLALAPTSLAPLAAWAAAAVVVVALSIPAWRTWAPARQAAPSRGPAGALAAETAPSKTPAATPAAPDGGATVVAETTAAGSVSGTVVDGQRAPLADAEVELRDYYGDTPQLAVRTNGAGEFHFARVPFGYFWLSARRSGTVAAQRQIDVDANSSDVTDLRLTLWTSRPIHGSVVEADGAAVSGAKVVASFDDFRRSWPATSTTSGADGRFTLADVPLHPIQLSVFAAGHVPLRAHAVPADENEVRLTLSPDAPATLHVRLDPVPGVDLSHGLEGPVHLRIAPFGKTVSSRQERALYEFRQELDLPAGATSLDVRDLAPGDYEVVATCSAAQFHPSTQRVTASLEGPSTAAIVVDRLRAPIAIHGRVLGRDGAPVAGVRFTATSHGPPVISTHIVSDDLGSFSFVGAIGEQETVGFIPDDPGQLFVGDSTWLRRTWLPVVEGAPVELTLTACERILGRVVDSSGQPLAGCELQVSSAARPSGLLATSYAAVDGRFELAGALAGLPLELGIVGEHGGLSQTIEHKLEPAEQRIDVVLQIPRFARIRGRVIDEEGRPIGGAWVRAIPAATQFVWPGEFWFRALATAITDEDGRFVLDSIQPSTNRIGIGADPRATADVVELPIALAEGVQRDDVLFTLPRCHAAPGRIRVRVEWDDGTPEPEALVFSPPTNEYVVRLDKSATADFAGPAAGTQGVFARYIQRTTAGAVCADSEIVEAAPGGPLLTLRLKRSRFGRLTATLPDSIHAAELVGLQVSALLPSRADPNSRWVLEVPWSVEGTTLTLGPLSEGHYDQLSIEGPAIRRFRRAVDVAPDRTTDLGLLKLEPLASVETRVSDSTGAPLGDAEFDEQADLLHPGGRILSTRTTLQADEGGIIDLPGNTDRGVFRAPGFAPCQWHRTVNKPGSVVLLREGVLRLRDVPDAARTNPSPWCFAVEVHSDETTAASYPQWLMYGASVVSCENDLLPHLPATRVVVHFWRGNDLTAGRIPDRPAPIPEQPEPGRYYRIEATVLADQVSDVAIAPKH